jgi:glycosyltransferase involved in cell wall biosynthesis
MNSRSVSVNADRTAAIVPAFNEERTVGGIVRALKGARGIDEIIVVDDGSEDRTADEAASAGADQILRLPENIGKGGALQRGVSATSAGILFFCDADFIGLTADHIERLLLPVREGRMAMCTGLRERGPVLDWLIARLPHISGIRALRRELFEGLPARFVRRFRVEIAQEYFCKVNSLACETMPLTGITHVRKMQKIGFTRGLSAYSSMIWQIAEVSLRARRSKNEFLPPHAS